MSAIIKTQKERELFEKWNKKLEQYDDCNHEDYGYPEPTLITYHSYKFRKKKVVANYETTLEYFGKCRELLVTGKFPSPKHKRIWALYSEGMSLRAIGRKYGHSNQRIRQFITEVKRSNE